MAPRKHAHVLVPPSPHHHARGRNGPFVPRLVEAEYVRAPDGKLLTTVRVYSRRIEGEAPIEITIERLLLQRMLADLAGRLDAAD